MTLYEKHARLQIVNYLVWKRRILSRFMIKLFPCSSQFSMQLIMFLNDRMKTIVGITTFISIIKTRSESLKAGKVFIFQHFSLYEQLKFHAQLS